MLGQHFALFARTAQLQYLTYGLILAHNPHGVGTVYQAVGGGWNYIALAVFESDNGTVELRTYAAVTQTHADEAAAFVKDDAA